MTARLRSLAFAIGGLLSVAVWPAKSNAAAPVKLVRLTFTGTYTVVRHTASSSSLVANGYGDVPTMGRAALELRLVFDADRGRNNHCAHFAGTGNLTKLAAKNHVSLTFQGSECSNRRSQGFLVDSGTYRVSSGSGHLRGASGAGKLQGIESAGSNGTVVVRMNGTLILP